MGRRRPAVAAVLALALAGLGHAYLRRWGRAAAWFLVIVTTGVVLTSTFADPDAGIAELPPAVLGPVVVLFVLSAVDAYLLAARAPAASEFGSGGKGEHRDGTGAGTGARIDATAGDEHRQCPNCGREVDPELDFCHWCTRPLSFDEDTDDPRDRDRVREGE